jgi:hypothetical protein
VGRPFSGAVENCKLLAMGKDFRHHFEARRKKGLYKEKEKREARRNREV